MPSALSPAVIARETLKQLLARKMAPSPDNYRAIYNEIAGTPDTDGGNTGGNELKSILFALPKETPAQQRLSRQLDQLLKNDDAQGFRSTLIDFIKDHSAESDLGWSDVIAELLRQWEAKQAGLTQARKREALDRVLATGSRNNELLFERLQNLAKSWSLNVASSDDIVLTDGEAPLEPAPESPVASTASARPVPISRASELLPEVRELFVFTLEATVATQLADAPELENEARAIAAAVRGATTLKAIQELQSSIKKLAYKLEYLNEDRTELRNGLVKLLQMMVDNVNELVLDDHWLNGQIAMVREIITRPLNPRTINDARLRLQEVVFKQSQLKNSLLEARESLKQLLAGFVDHLAEFSDSTSDYHDKIERCAEKISKADDISQLQDVLAEVMRETRIIQINAQRSRDDLRVSKQRVDEAERRINELQSELDKASSLVRNDQLTGTLNRRGLEEMFEGEASRARRRNSPLCVAMLDIDNFKKLNDSLGHDAGDAALIHLVTVTRETLRPHDTLARFGGEEFVILLPDTSLDDAQKVLMRVQRELTRRIFLNKNEKILITFSAGVTELLPDDNQASVTKRADEAMYTAKKTGKNRVITK